MTIDRLREVHRAQPFRPYRLRMSDGGDILVSHPEALAFSESGRTAVVFSPDDKTEFFDLLHVSRIEVVNGPRPRRRRD